MDVQKPGGGEKMLSASIPAELYDEVEAYAGRSNLSWSSLVQPLLEQWLQRQREEEARKEKYLQMIREGLEDVRACRLIEKSQIWARLSYEIAARIPATDNKLPDKFYWTRKFLEDFERTVTFVKSERRSGFEFLILGELNDMLEKRLLDELDELKKGARRDFEKVPMTDGEYHVYKLFVDRNFEVSYSWKGDEFWVLRVWHIEEPL